MKKVVTLLLALIMVVSMFAACTPASDPAEGSGSDTKAPAASGNRFKNLGF